MAEQVEFRDLGGNVIEVDEATHRRWCQEEIDRCRAEEDALERAHKLRMEQIADERQRYEAELDQVEAGGK